MSKRTTRHKTLGLMMRLFFILLIIVGTVSCKDNGKKHSNSEYHPIDASQQKSKTELIIEWKAWLEQNNKYNIYLYDAVTVEHAWAINSLCNMSYSGDDKIRGDIEMIQWVLDTFCPIDTTNEEKEQYEKLEKQVYNLLNFEVDLYQGYEVRRKSAISRLLHEFKIKVYEEKLRSKIQDQEIKKIFEEEVAAWNKYIEATSDAFGKIVLGKDSYYLKYVFWNNYDFDIMEQRYRSLACIFLNDYSIWNVDNQCRWDEVGYEYDHLPEKIKRLTTSEYDYTFQEKIESLNADEEAFKAFLNAHFALVLKMDVIDEGYLLRHKSNTMERFLEHYDRPESLKF